MTLETEDSLRNFSFLWEYQINVVSSCNKECEANSIKHTIPMSGNSHICILLSIYIPTNILVIRFWTYKFHKVNAKYIGNQIYKFHKVNANVCMWRLFLSIHIAKGVYIEQKAHIKHFTPPLTAYIDFGIYTKLLI